MIKLEEDKRLNLFKRSLSLIPKTKGFVIFRNPISEKFIQFAWNDGHFYLDIPYGEKCSTQPSLQEIKKHFSKLDIGEMSVIKLCNLKEAVEYTEVFFKKVCNLKENYLFTIKVIVE